MKIQATSTSRTKVRKRLVNSPVTMEEILACSIEQSNGCIEWTAGRNRKGYGVIRRNGRAAFATRWVMHLLFGFELSSSKMVLHKCDNPPCINPDHLYLGTETENTRDKVSRKRHNFGARVPQSKLIDRDIVEIFKLRSNGMDFTEIARRFGVTKNTARCVVRRLTWKHIEIPEDLKWLTSI